MGEMINTISAEIPQGKRLLLIGLRLDMEEYGA
jgi:hypothetical protein